MMKSFLCYNDADIKQISKFIYLNLPTYICWNIVIFIIADIEDIEFEDYNKYAP